MKYSIFIILMFLLLSCDDKVEKRLKDVADDIIANPNKLYDIKKNFKEFYSDKYACCSLNDSSRINETVDHIKKDFDIRTKDYYFEMATYYGNDLEDIDCMKSQMDNFKNVEFYSFLLCKDKYNCFAFLFVKPFKNKNEFYLVWIDNLVGNMDP